MITYKTLVEKFEDKGIDISILMLNLPQIPIFDPSCTALQHTDREDLRVAFERTNQWRLDLYKEKLQELDVWIDHQKHK